MDYVFSIAPIYRFFFFPFSIINYERYFGFEEVSFQYYRLERMVNIFGYIDNIEKLNEEDGVILFEKEMLSGRLHRFDEGFPRMSLYDFSIIIIPNC